MIPLRVFKSHRANSHLHWYYTVDLKVQLNGTEYGELTHALPSPLTTGMLGGSLRDKFVSEFRYLQSNATGKFAHIELMSQWYR